MLHSIHLVGTYDVVRDLLVLILIVQYHDGSESDGAVIQRIFVNNDSVLDQRLQLQDARLVFCLRCACRVILRVFGQVTETLGYCDILADLFALLLLSPA